MAGLLLAVASLAQAGDTGPTSTGTGTTSPADDAGTEAPDRLASFDADAAGDVNRSGTADALRHIDIVYVTAEAANGSLYLRVVLGARWPGLTDEDHLNYQVLLDHQNGQNASFPTDSGWDASIVCRPHREVLAPEDCVVVGHRSDIANAAVTSDGFVVTVNATAWDIRHLRVGAGAAHQKLTGTTAWSGFDFTPEADPFAFLDVEDTPRADGGIGPWWLVPIGAVLGLVLGWRWKRAMDRHRPGAGRKKA